MRTLALTTLLVLFPHSLLVLAPVAGTLLPFTLLRRWYDHR